MGIITFNGVSSNSFGIEVSSPPRYVIPEEDVAQMHIPGVNGDKLRRYRSFKNIQIQYAITFLAPQYQYGDVDRDGSVTAADASAILRYLDNPSRESFDSQQQVLADVNHDGSISQIDAMLILQGLTGQLAGMTMTEMFGDNSVGYRSSIIAGWLHPCYTNERMEVMEVNDAVNGGFTGNKEGYIKLYDTYNPGFFRKAFCKNALEIIDVYSQGGAGTLVFESTPEKWYNAGYTWMSGAEYQYASSPILVDPSNSKMFINPSRFSSLPIVRIYRDESFISQTDDWDGDLMILNVPYEAITFNNGVPTINLDSLGIAEKHIHFKPFYGSNSSSGVMYIDFQNGNAYSPRVYSFPPSREDINGYMRTRISTVAGLLTPGINIIGVKVTRPNAADIYPNFEVLPRWWTL